MSAEEIRKLKNVGNHRRSILWTYAPRDRRAGSRTQRESQKISQSLNL